MLLILVREFCKNYVFTGIKKAEENSAGLGCGFIFGKADDYSLTVRQFRQGTNLFLFTPDFCYLLTFFNNSPKILLGWSNDQILS